MFSLSLCSYLYLLLSSPLSSNKMDYTPPTETSSAILIPNVREINMVSMRVQEGQGTSASASSPASASGSGSACTAEGGSISGVRSVIMGSGQTVSSQVTKEGLIGRTHSKHIMKVSMHVCIRFEMIDTFSILIPPPRPRQNCESFFDADPIRPPPWNLNATNPHHQSPSLASPMKRTTPTPIRPST